MSRIKIIGTGLALALALAAGCNAGGKTADTTSGAGGDTGPTSGSGGDLASVTGVGGGTGGGDTCHTESAEGERKELDMLVVLDRSLSMAQSSLWDPSVSALTEFFEDSASTGVRASIGFFPPEAAVDACDPNIYNPPSVGLSALPTDSQTLVDAMAATTPGGDNTPTYGALYGSLQWAQLHQDANEDRVVVVVFASDGEPTECNTDNTAIAQIASTAVAYNGLRTFTVAISGADVTKLDEIAAAGGTMEAIDITSDITLFKQKMEEIRERVLGCEFDVPQPMNGEFDETRVNIDVAPDDQTTPDTIPQVPSEAECGTDPGWYYDAGNTNRIVLCPATCQIVQNSTTAIVSFAFGCPTIVK